jgi:dihydroorotate dehydrogenase (NAD+) catalytic subunit
MLRWRSWSSWAMCDVLAVSDSPNLFYSRRSRWFLSRLQEWSSIAILSPNSFLLPFVTQQDSMSSLAVRLNRLQLPNPILVASGTFGYAKEMTAFVDFPMLGGIIPKTVTPQPRAGNPPPRTVETTGGMLNSIGLDNDGFDQFVEEKLPYLLTLGAPVIVNIAARTTDEFHKMAAVLNAQEGVAAVELNISCPNVSGGVDFGTNPELAAEVVTAVRSAGELPVIAKLTPNVTSVVPIAQAVAAAGCDAVSLINTFQGMAVDWKRRKPILGNRLGGLSGPAIKPLALRIIWQVAQAVDVPIIGIGGIQCLDDVMDFLVTGASAVQLGTVNFYDPGISSRIVGELQTVLEEEGVERISDLVGTLE